MKNMDLKDFNYLGIDIVDELITRNNGSYSSDNISFKTVDIVVDDMPKADLFICRDCLIHLSLWDGVKAIRNVKKSGSLFLLATTFPATKKNSSLDTNFFRALNLELPPFNFPPPIDFIDENCSLDGGKCKNKILGLWVLNEINC